MKSHPYVTCDLNKFGSETNLDWPFPMIIITLFSLDHYKQKKGEDFSPPF